MSEQEIAAMVAELKRQIREAAQQCHFETTHARRQQTQWDFSDESGPQYSAMCEQCARYVSLMHGWRSGVLMVLRACRAKQAA